MMDYGSSSTRWRRLSAVSESVELELDGSDRHHLWQSSYRDSIRSVSIGPSRSARFYPRNDGESSHGSSTSSSSASASLHARSTSYSSSGSSSTDGMSPFNGVHELHAIALQMVNQGYIRGIIRAFSGVEQAHGGGPDPDHEKLIVERWFSELDVEWILHVGAADSAHREEQGGGMPLDLASLQDMMERWIRALLTMVRVFFITHLELRAKRSTAGGVRTAIQYIQMLVGMSTPAGATGETASSEHEEQVTLFARFAEVSVLRMLAFIDVVSDAASTYHWAPEALPGMLQVYACVADASPTLLALFKEATAVFKGMNGVFLRKRTKLSNTIWSMMAMVRASFFTEDCCRTTLQLSGPGGVHETTRMMIKYVALLWRNQGALNFVLQDHHFSVFVSEDEGFNSVVNLIVDMIASLEKHLVDASNSIADHGLRYIFLANNSDFISQQLRSLDLPSWFPSDDSKIQRYIDAYLQASWTPVLSCLYIDIPFRIRRYVSLSKFESEFHTVCNSHRLWKVPDPELRKRLRKAIVERVIPLYTRYLQQRSAGSTGTTV